MKILSNLLLGAYGLKCLWAFIDKQGTIWDGVFLLSVIIFFAVKLEIALPVDDK